MVVRYQITLDDDVAREFEERAKELNSSAAAEIQRFLTERRSHLREQEKALKVERRTMTRREKLLQRFSH